MSKTAFSLSKFYVFSMYTQVFLVLRLGCFYLVLNGDCYLQIVSQGRKINLKPCRVLSWMRIHICLETTIYLEYWYPSIVSSQKNWAANIEEVDQKNRHFRVRFVEKQI